MKIVSAVLVVAGAVFCGYLYGRRGTSVTAGAPHDVKNMGYTCPMHPFILKEGPGSCPICGMELVKKVAGAAIADQSLTKLRHVSLSPTQQVMANLATDPVTLTTFNREIPITGVVAYNQERQEKVTTLLAGRLDHLLVKSIGARVVQGKPVAEIYSHELVTAQEDYLLAYKELRLFGSTIVPTFTQNSLGSLYEAQQRLRQLDFSKKQLEELQKSGKPALLFPIISPLSGVVTEKHVQEGQYVNVGDPLFNVADLSVVWVELEAFEADLPYLKLGQEVAIRAPTLPGDQPLPGRVKYIYPFLDPKTRTVKLRVELPNPGLKLKPEMYVSALIKVRLGPSLTVAQNSILDTGGRKIVWVETTPGVFLPREVTTGARSGDRVQILSGLQAGERVALKGGYLIDSESQLTHGQNEGAAGGLDMSDMKMPQEGR